MPRTPDIDKYKKIIVLLEKDTPHRDIQEKLKTSPNTIQNAIQWNIKNKDNNNNNNNNNKKELNEKVKRHLESINDLYNNNDNNNDNISKTVILNFSKYVWSLTQGSTTNIDKSQLKDNLQKLIEAW